ncbi:MAG: hypothetical protein F6K08_27570, partial [Okeania sp. SIO1H6]|nr:hypothetical protein [Okeania sp. SIO1H6]
GSDRFLINLNQGADIITDFDINQDFLVLTDGLTTDEQNLTINPVGDNISIFWNDQLLVTLENLSATSGQIASRLTTLNDSFFI